MWRLVSGQRDRILAGRLTSTADYDYPGRHDASLSSRGVVYGEIAMGRICAEREGDGAGRVVLEVLVGQ